MDEVKKDELPVGKEKANGKKGGKPYKKQGTGKAPREQQDKKQLRNSYKLYAFDEEVAKLYGSLSFNEVTATGMPLFRDENGNDEFKHLPTICAISYVPFTGGSSGPLSGINTAAKQLFMLLRKAAGGGAKVYEAPDLMLYILAMEDIYGQYLEIKRALELANTNVFMNRSYPELVLAAAGYDYEDVKSNYWDYVTRMELLRSRINAFAVPAYFNTFTRRAVLASQIYSDSSSLRSGIYLFRRSGYFKYNQTKYETGGCLEYKPYLDPNGIVKLDDAITHLEDCFNSIAESEDMGTMMGDILNAYSKGFLGEGLYSLPEITMFSANIAVYDEDILAQIENSRAYFLKLDNGGFDIKQENGNIIHEAKIEAEEQAPQTSYNQATSKCTPILNSHKDSPEYSDVIEWTRLLAVPNGDGTLSSGLEIVVSYTLWQYSDNGTIISSPFRNVYFDPGDELSNFNVVINLMQFDWHPAIYGVGKAGGNYTYQSGPGMDLKVHTVVPVATLTKINYLATYSAYFKPNATSK